MYDAMKRIVAYLGDGFIFEAIIVGLDWNRRVPRMVEPRLHLLPIRRMRDRLQGGILIVSYHPNARAC
jgi:hypothetical protein